MKLSVALATYNEQENIQDCLESVMEIADEIIVVDGSSTDNTRKIAKELKAKVKKVKNRKNFHINKQIAIDECQNPWILQLDADERITPELAEEIKEVLNSDYDKQPSAYYLKRRNYFLGRWMKKTGMYPDPVIRLFKKGKARLPQKTVHELMEVDGETKWLKNDLLHIADPTFSRYLVRSNRYTTLEAENLLKKDPGTGILQVLNYFAFKPTWRFLSLYIRHKGFMDGFPGFVFSTYSALHLTTSYVKYWEKKHTGKDVTLEKDWD